MSEFHSLLWLDIPLFVLTTFCLSNSSVDGQLGWLLWIMLLWTLMYKYFLRVPLWILLGLYLGLELLGHIVILWLLFEKLPVIHSCAILHSQWTRVPIFPHPPPTLIFWIFVCLFIMTAILMSVKDYLTVIWMYISLMSEVLGREMIRNVLYVSLLMRYAEKTWK